LLEIAFLIISSPENLGRKKKIEHLKEVGAVDGAVKGPKIQLNGS
jgi:hypothetical protein